MLPSNFDARDAVEVMGAFIDNLETCDLRPAFEAIVDDFGTAINENFEETKGPNGLIWAPHAPLTIQLYGVHPLLKLFNVMHPAVTRRFTEGRIEEIDLRKMTIGTDLWYAARQQYGQDYGPRIPARPFLWLPGEWIERLAVKFSREVFDIVTKDVG